MKQVSIIFPNQIFRESPILKINCEILILEDSLFFGNDKFHKLINHKNKLVFHRASMLAYKKYLEISGFKVLYIENKNNISTKTCPVCNRPFEWRKKWKTCWDDVIYCSKRCSKRKSQR